VAAGDFEIARPGLRQQARVLDLPVTPGLKSILR
jgi:hypothetical protein